MVPTKLINYILHRFGNFNWIENKSDFNWANFIENSNVVKIQAVSGHSSIVSGSVPICCKNGL